MTFPKINGQVLDASEVNNAWKGIMFFLSKPEYTTSLTKTYSSGVSLTNEFYFFDSLTVDSGVTLTLNSPTGRTLIFVFGSATINGNITLSSVAGGAGGVGNVSGTAGAYTVGWETSGSGGVG